MKANAGRFSKKKVPVFKRRGIGSKVYLPTRNFCQSYLGFIQNQEPEFVSMAQMDLHPSVVKF